MRLFGDICILALSLVRLPIAQQSANGVEARPEPHSPQPEAPACAHPTRDF